MSTDYIGTTYIDDDYGDYTKNFTRFRIRSFGGETHSSFAETIQLSEIVVNGESTEWKLGVKEWLILVCISILVMLDAFDATVVIPIIPGLSSAFDQQFNNTLWLGTSYLLANAASQLFFSILAEAFGHGPLLLAAVVVSTVGTGVCGGSMKFPDLVAGRLIQGIGGGGVTAVSLLIVADTIPDKHRIRFSGYVCQIRLAGTILGPLLGGLFYEYVGWRWTFYSSFVFCALGMLVVPFAVDLRGHRGVSIRTLQTMDWPGAVLILLGVGCILIGISWGGTLYAWNDWRTLAPIALGVSAMLILILYEIKWAMQPVFSLGGFMPLPMLMIYIGGFLQGLLTFCQLQSLTMYLIFVKYLSPTLTGLSLVAVTGLALSILMLAERLRFLTKNYYSPWMTRVGWMLNIIATGCFAAMDSATPTAGWLFISFAAGIGHGLLVAGYNRCIQTAPCNQTQEGQEEDEECLATSPMLMCSLLRTWGMCIAVPVSGTMVLNRLVLYSGAEILERPLWNDKDVMSVACANSLQFLWVVFMGVAALGGLSSFFIKVMR